MNIAKFYLEAGGKIKILRFRVCQPRSWQRSGPTIAEIGDRMAQAGYTPRKPAALRRRPKEQRPGYRPPSERTLRRARQTIRAGGRRAA